MFIRKKQKGFFLIEAMVALGVFGTIAAIGAQKYVEGQQDTNAEYVGKRLAVYNSAVRSYIGTNAATILNGENHLNDVKWLKTAATCGVGNGTGTDDLVPCSFFSDLPFGLQYNTTFTKVGSQITGTTSLGRIVISGGVRMDLSEIARKSAISSGYSVGSQVTAASPITASVFTDYTVDYTAGLTEGVISGVSSNNSSTDAWLRTDGSNKMLADLNNGGNNIKNLKSIAVGIAKVPSNIDGRIDAAGSVNTDTYMESTGTGVATNNKIRVGGAANSNLNGPTITSSSGNLNQTSKTGNVELNAAGWAVLSGDATGVATNTPKIAQGSLNVNDIQVRSAGNKWLSDVFDRLPNVVFKASQLVNNGDIIQKPACGTGTAKIYLMPKDWASIGAGYQYNWYATNLGLSWRAEMWLKIPVFNGGGPLAGYAIQGIAQLYCVYPQL